MATEVPVYVCTCAAKYIPELAALVNGGTRPAATTIGGVEFYFEKPDDKMRRHENKHIEQYASFAPFWTRAFPLSWKAWIGSPKFVQAYIAENNKFGYQNNKFEVEARAAEEG